MDKGDLHHRLETWLESQGYPLEMTVAAELQRAQFRVFQSEYYTDPESGDFREIDLVAYRQREVNGILVRVTLTIECKLSRDKPWVLFTSLGPRLSERASVAQRAASLLGRLLLRELGSKEEIQQLPLFQEGNRSGYGITQGFTTGTDVTFAAIMSAAKAADARAREASEASDTQGDFAEIVFPVIVVDGILFEYFLTATSERVLSEIGAGILVWRNPVVGVPHTIIHVVTRDALQDFIARASETANHVLSRCDVELEVARERLAGMRQRRSSSRLPSPTV